MRVLGLSSYSGFWSMGPGSGANSFFLAPHAYVSAGHEMHMAQPRIGDQPAEETYHGIRVHHFRGAIRFESNTRHILPVRLASRVFRYCYYVVYASLTGLRLGRRIRPHLVIGYGEKGAVPAAVVAWALGIPNITRLFGLQLHLYLRHRWKLPGAFMEIFALKVRKSYLVMHNDGSKGDEIARRFGVPPERIRFWRDGYEPEMYRPGERSPALRDRLGIPQDHVIIFCVGRLGEDKRMGRLVEILPDILRAEPKVTLLLVGEGPDRADIESRVRELGLEASVRLPGAVPRDELPQYLNLGDIFAGVSDRTNANLSPIEAMSCARPVVVLDSGGTSDLVEDGRSGILVAPGRWREDLAPALIALIRDPARRAALGQGARERIAAVIPTLERRTRMEAELGEQAVREFEETGARRARRGRG